MFIEFSTTQPIVSWPAPGGITEQQAKTICEDRIINLSYIGNSCASKLRNDTTTRNIIQGCIDDIQVRLTIYDITACDVLVYH